MIRDSNDGDNVPSPEAALSRKNLLQAFADYEALAKRIRFLPINGTPGLSQERIQKAIGNRAALFLQKNMVPLKVFVIFS